MKKSVIHLSLIVLISLIVDIQAGTYSGGTGEPNDPYLISTAADMAEIGTHIEDWNNCFLLISDINLIDYNETNFNTIGNDSNAFTGVFDGNGHTIINLTLRSASSDYVGLFGYVDEPNSEIKDLRLIDPNIQGDEYIGALVGRLRGGTIINCGVVSGVVAGRIYVGGLAGYKSYPGKISNCYTTVDVKGSQRIGGLVGYSEVSISNCHATGNVSGDESVGGLVGENFAPSSLPGISTIEDSYATGAVYGNELIGGLVGENSGTIFHCYATGYVSGTGWYTGGLVGGGGGTIWNSYAYGTVSGETNTGGLVGGSYYGKIRYCYAKGEVNGNGAVGGLVGYFNNGMILNSYAEVNTFGNYHVGGLMGGFEVDTIWSCYACYAAGAVNGNAEVGGLVGHHYSGSYSNCFWDANVNPDMNGIGNMPDDPEVIGESTANMKIKATYTGEDWDFVGEEINGSSDIWRMCVDGAHYPKLWWEFTTGDFVCPDGVDFTDFAVFAMTWLLEEGEAGYNPICDISVPTDETINILDLCIFAENWLAGQ